MPSRNILHLSKQRGSFHLDADACFEEMKDELGELYEESTFQGVIPHMFCCEEGQIKVFDGGYDSGHVYGTSVVTWGFGIRGFLESLAMHLTGKGSLTFVYTPEGNPPSVYLVTAGKVEEIS